MSCSHEIDFNYFNLSSFQWEFNTRRFLFTGEISFRIRFESNTICLHFTSTWQKGDVNLIQFEFAFLTFSWIELILKWVRIKLSVQLLHYCLYNFKELICPSRNALVIFVRMSKDCLYGQRTFPNYRLVQLCLCSSVYDPANSVNVINSVCYSKTNDLIKIFFSFCILDVHYSQIYYSKKLRITY